MNFTSGHEQAAVTSRLLLMAKEAEMAWLTTLDYSTQLLLGGGRIQRTDIWTSRIKFTSFQGFSNPVESQVGFCDSKILDTACKVHTRISTVFLVDFFSAHVYGSWSHGNAARRD